VGDERLDGRPPEERRLGILFQDDLLFPHLSVGDNLAFGLRTQRARRAARRKAIAQALESVGLTGFEARDPATLSGGQRARVSLLRVLLSEPRGLLLDEPFGRLDPGTRVQTRRWVFDELRRRQLPTLLVTHDLDDVAAADGPSVLLIPGPET
jgi:putative thiamine transport system ATP-binding protein